MAVEVGQENIPTGKAVLVAQIKRDRTPRSAAEDQTGAPEPR